MHAIVASRVHTIFVMASGIDTYALRQFELSCFLVDLKSGLNLFASQNQRGGSRGPISLHAGPPCSSRTLSLCLAESARASGVSLRRVVSRADLERTRYRVFDYPEVIQSRIVIGVHVYGLPRCGLLAPPVPSRGDCSGNLRVGSGLPW